jgi:hypothetical protein
MHWGGREGGGKKTEAREREGGKEIESGVGWTQHVRGDALRWVRVKGGKKGGR